ncbi:MAG: EAL domain-containing protein [Lysobacteraceae bacterium]
MRAQTEAQSEATESRSPLLDSATLAARVSRTDMLLAGRRASDLLVSLANGFRERFGDCRFALWLPDGADDERETQWLVGGADADGGWLAPQSLAEAAIATGTVQREGGEPLLLAAPLFAEGGVSAALVCEVHVSPAPGGGESALQGWFADAANLLVQRLPAALELERLHLAVHRLADAERLQRALYSIADLANSELDMDDMMARIHAVIAELMYAENFYIALLDNANRDLYFPYFRDVADSDPPPPGERYPLSDYDGSLTAFVLTRGEALLGPSLQLATEHGTPGGYGPQSVDWLGVPMRHGGDVIGVIVVQSYDVAHRYNTRSLELLTFVSQHIATAIERKRSHDLLERRVRERTAELNDANRALQQEVEERQRSERLQAALFRIAELGSTSESAEAFYGSVHQVVGELLYAGNFFIALLGEGGDTIQFAYSVDEYDVDRAPRKFGAGLTEYVIRTGKPLLADRDTNRRLHEAGEILSHGARATIWLGVPLICDDKTVGVLAVQSYDADHNYTARDQELLTFVSYHIANALMRKQAADSLREAAELETRVNERTQELFSANRDLREQISERERMERQLKHDALHDALTGLPNRAHLMNRLDDALRHFLGPARQAFAVLFLDLDRFKVINDSVGHLVGDQLLKQVANRIARCVEGDGLVARLGGDEFAVLLESIRGQEDAETVAQRIIAELETPVRVGGKDLYSSTSIGIVLGQTHYHTPEELLRDADVALYRAKASGRRCHVVFDETLRREALLQLEMEGNLRRALACGEFDAFYQPIQSLREGQVTGYEALMRWRQADGGIMAPGEFLQSAEETGLLEAIDLQVYERVFQQGRELLGGGNGFVSINVGARHFRNPHLVADIEQRLSSAGLHPEQLRIEVTERTLLEDPLQVRELLNKFDEFGVTLALDDFGTGYSSLSYLHQFPFHAIKLDRSFVSALGDDERGSAEAVLQAVCSLGRSLGMEVIAEGIETDAQRRALIALGCEFGQGFLMARPLPLSELIARRR